MKRIRITQAELDEIVRRHAMFRAARMGGARAILAYHDLTGLDLAGHDLSHADFTGATMCQTDMRDSRLDYAVLFSADMRLATMQNASMIRADMRGVCMRGAMLVNADMTGVDLREGAITTKDGTYMVPGETELHLDTGGVADLSGANLSQARLAGAVANNCDFSDAVMKGCRIVRACLQGVNMQRANLEDADLSLCDVKDANLRGAILINVTTQSTKLHEADLSDALTEEPRGPTMKDLPDTLPEMLRQHLAWLSSDGKSGRRFEVDLYDLRRAPSLAHSCLSMMRGRGAMLYGLDFKEAQMQVADMRGADMRHANFHKADLRGSDFTAAIFNNANFQGVQMQPLEISANQSVSTFLARASMRFVNFAGGDLRMVDFSSADLTGANFLGADLTGANFTGAILNGARFSPAQRDLLGVPKGI